MTSVWGVDHGDVSKAAWKAFYPVPPKVNKIPRGKLKITSHLRGAHQSYEAHAPRGGSVGYLSVGDHGIGMANVKSGFRRRGIASNLLARADKDRGAKIPHSTERSLEGDAFARGNDKKRGVKTPTSFREQEIGRRKIKGGLKIGQGAMRQGSRRVEMHSQMSRSGIFRGKKKIVPKWMS